MSTSGMSINVDQSLVKPIIEAQVQAAIFAEMSKSSDKLIHGMVQSMLTQKVDSEGRPSDSYSAKSTYIEWLCMAAIREAARKAVGAWVTENQEKLDVEVAKQFKASGGKMAKIFVEGIMESLSTKWRMNVEIALDNKDERNR